MTVNSTVRRLSGPLKRLFRLIYRPVRLILPVTGPILYYGIPGPHSRRLGDRQFARYLPELPSPSDEPAYELKLMHGLEQTIRPGDRIVVVGGGMGITSAHAARLAGPTGRVVCYEGAVERIPEIELTASRNGLSDRIEVRNEIVGDPISIYGGRPTDHSIRPRQLPDCDVLELDCEGSERGIFAEMTIRPRAIVVETHGSSGSPTYGTKVRLEAMGYAVSDLGIAEPRFPEMCLRNDIRVLVATRR